jgi:hypothetical protein
MSQNHFITKLKAAEAPEIALFRKKVAELGGLTDSSTGGSRNELLNAAAFYGGKLVAQELIEAYFVTTELEAASEENGYSADYGLEETQRIIRAGLTEGMEDTPTPPHDNPIYDMILTADQLASLPPVEWLVDDLLLENSLAVLVGEPGIGKSFMAIDLAASIAGALDTWHGRKISRPGTTLYLAGEGVSGLNNRRMAWEKIHKVKLGKKLEILPYPIQAGTRDWNNFVDYVEDTKPSLIVIDTLAKTSGEFEESTQMSKYLNECDRLKVASGGTVLVLHHPNKSGAYRGGTGIKGDVDTLMFLYDEQGGEVNLFINKQKDGNEGSVGMFRLKNVGIGQRPDGKMISSAVFANAGASPFEYAREE